MRKHNLAFIDIETTGLNVLEHEIIQIGCVVTDPEFNILEEFEIKIKPEQIEKADKVALRINKYDPADWVFAYTLAEGMKIFSKKVKNCIMLSHNIVFDFSFLEAAFLKTKIENSMHFHKLDTISFAWAKLHKKKEINHFSLRELCLYFNIENKNAHTALSDARATYELYKKLMSL
jgi:DNA polymerase III epsilon subunit-like protein